MADKDQYVCPASVPPAGMVNLSVRFSEAASVRAHAACGEDIWSGHVSAYPPIMGDEKARHCRGCFPKGECELPEGHEGDHFDGLSWFNDDGEMTDDAHT